MSYRSIMIYSPMDGESSAILCTSKLSNLERIEILRMTKNPIIVTYFHKSPHAKNDPTLNCIDPQVKFSI